MGFTIDSSNYFLGQLIASKIKEAAPQILVIFGGLLPTLHARTILETNSFVDICIRNEGEETCLELIPLLDDANFQPGQSPWIKSGELPSGTGKISAITRTEVYMPITGAFTISWINTRPLT